MRTMKLQAAGRTVYESSFDPRTGTIVRAVDDWEIREVINLGGLNAVGHRQALPHEVREALQKRFPHRYNATPSPSPELIDVGITSQCSMNCPYCYTDSKPDAEHAPKELVPNLIKGLDTPPYQIAIGGGEPTLHPDLPWILEQARSLGTVPNYTTGGGKGLTSKVIQATNAFCGGVALTLHSWRGWARFAKNYHLLLGQLTCQLNVHLLADMDVVVNLRALTELQEETKTPINLVLLAYYPDVGRAGFDRMMNRTLYSRDLPDALSYAKAMGMQIAFSEGLLPYFLSRPELGIDTTFATPCEGLFSCYVDPRGFMWSSSFNVHEDPPHNQTSILEGGKAQKLWEQLNYYGGEHCEGCEQANRCSCPCSYLKHLCKHEAHNQLPLKGQPLKGGRGRSAYQRLMEDDD